MATLFTITDPTGSQTLTVDQGDVLTVTFSNAVTAAQYNWALQQLNSAAQGDISVIVAS